METKESPVMPAHDHNDAKLTLTFVLMFLLILAVAVDSQTARDRATQKEFALRLAYENNLAHCDFGCVVVEGYEPMTYFNRTGSPVGIDFYLTSFSNLHEIRHGWSTDHKSNYTLIANNSVANWPVDWSRFG